MLYDDICDILYVDNGVVIHCQLCIAVFFNCAQFSWLQLVGYIFLLSLKKKMKRRNEKDENLKKEENENTK